MVNTFEGLLALLVAKEVRFMIVGGIAVSLNGFVRTTEDMDILVDAESSNLGNLLGCLSQFGEGCARELAPADFIDEEGAIRVQEDFDLDIFVRMRGKVYADMIGEMRWHKLSDGTEIPYLSATGLIRLKEGSFREKDLIDIGVLSRITAQTRENIGSAGLDSLRTLPPEW